jgi:hypothetical protein
MKLRTKYWRSGLVVAGVVVALLGSTMAFARNANPDVFPIKSRPYGQTYGQWSARWWQYAFQQTDLNICAPDKPGSRVTFLAGTTGGSATRSCTVSVGKAIMFPVFNAEWSVVEAQAQQQTTPGQSCLLPGQPNGTSDAALQACATAQANHALDSDATLKADVDRVTLQRLTNYRAVSPPFNFTSVPGNPLGVCQPAGCDSHAVADGFWIILTPLRPGPHTIHFAATVPFPELNFTFNTDTTYHLTVQPGQ